MSKWLEGVTQFDQVDPVPVKPDVVGGFGCPLADRSRTAVLAESRDDEQTFGRDTSRTCDHIRL